MDPGPAFRRVPGTACNSRPLLRWRYGTSRDALGDSQQRWFQREAGVAIEGLLELRKLAVLLEQCAGGLEAPALAMDDEFAVLTVVEFESVFIHQVVDEPLAGRASGSSAQRPSAACRRCRWGLEEAQDPTATGRDRSGA